MAIAGRAPYEIAGRRDALFVFERTFEHPGLLDLDVFVIGELGAGREAEQRGDEAAFLVLQENLHIDA